MSRAAPNTDIGQNFLRDRSVARWMASRASLGPDDAVLEIGPGRGALTEQLLGTECGSLDAIELDVRLAPDLDRWSADERATIHWGDAVTFDLTSLPRAPSHVIANIPYHITTPLIWHILEQLSGRGLRYMLLMVQREAAVRLASGAASRESSPLGVTLAAMGRTSIARRVPRGAFAPMPRVDSAIAEITLDGGRADLPRERKWRRLLSRSFAQRRKTLVNNWTSSFGMSREEAISHLTSRDLPATLRPEETSLSTWLSLFEDESFVTDRLTKDI